jgi:hypothetical protein
MTRTRRAVSAPSVSWLDVSGACRSIISSAASRSARTLANLQSFAVGTANGQSELSYDKVARGFLMRTAGSQSKLAAAVNGAAAGLAVVTIAVLGMWLFLVSY